MSTRIPLIAIFIVAFLLGLINVSMTGQFRIPTGWRAIEQLLLYALGYWWFYLDKEHRSFRSGPIQNVGVVLIPVIAIPVYMVRSRGASQGVLSILFFIVLIMAAIGAAVVGGAVGALK